MKRTKNVGLFLATFFVMIITYCNAKKTSLTRHTSIQPQISPAKPLQKENPRIIHLTNNITNDMVKYRWGWTEHAPTDFYLKLDDTPLEKGITKQVTIGENNILEVTYHYEFKNGLVKGSKTIEIEIPEEESHVNLSFSWKNNLRIISNVGRAIGSKNGVLKSAHSLS